MHKISKTEKKKDVTCAVIFLTPSKQVLIVHPNGAPWNCWSFPKGLAEDNELPAHAAVRELQEETSLIINANDLIDLGRYAYVSKKDYHLFLYQSIIEPSIKNLVCESKFINKKGDKTQEVDNFKLVPLTEVHNLLNKKQAEILIQLNIFENKLTDYSKFNMLVNYA